MKSTWQQLFYLIVAVLFVFSQVFSQQLTTFAGNGIYGWTDPRINSSTVSLGGPSSVAFLNGDLLVCELDSSRIRRVFANGTVITFAGGNGFGSGGDGQDATLARFTFPSGIIVDKNNDLLIAIGNNCAIRKVFTSNNTIITIAGQELQCGYNGDNIPATSAQLSNPNSIAEDPTTGNIYIADTGNHRVRMIDINSGNISTISGTGTQGYNGDGIPATSAQLNFPNGIFFSQSHLYIADTANHRVRVVFPNATIATVAGNGTAGYNGENLDASISQLSGPNSIFVDSKQNIYITEFQFIDFEDPFPINSRVRMMWSTNNTIVTIAGTGEASYSGDGMLATNATVNCPLGVILDSTEENILIVDARNSRIRQVNINSGIISTILGTGGNYYNGDTQLSDRALDAKFQALFGLAFDSLNGYLLLTDQAAGQIRRIDNTTKTISTVVGSISAIKNTAEGVPALEASLTSPASILVDGTDIIFAEFNNHRIRKLDTTTGLVTTIVGTGEEDSTGDGGDASQATIASPSSIVLDKERNLLIAEASGGFIRKVFRNNNTITTIASAVYYPYAMAINSRGDLFFTELFACVVKKIDSITKQISTVAGIYSQCGYNGDGISATSTKLFNPSGLFFDLEDSLYISDNMNHRIRKVFENGTIVTVVGTGVAGNSEEGIDASVAKIGYPMGLTGDLMGNLYFTDFKVIRKVSGLLPLYPPPPPKPIPTPLPSPLFSSPKPPVAYSSPVVSPSLSSPKPPPTAHSSITPITSTTPQPSTSSHSPTNPPPNNDALAIGLGVTAGIVVIAVLIAVVATIVVVSIVVTVVYTKNTAKAGFRTDNVLAAADRELMNI